MIPFGLPPALTQQIPQLPVWFVLLGGMIAACVFWPASPRVSLLTLLALLLLGLVTALGPSVNLWIVGLRQTQHWTTAQLGYYFMAAGTLLNLMRAAGFGLLLAAVFVGRRPPLLPPIATVDAPPPLDSRPL